MVHDFLLCDRKILCKSRKCINKNRRQQRLPLEQEYQAVDCLIVDAINGRGQAHHGVLVKAPELREFGVAGAKGFDEGGEQSVVGFDGAPAVFGHYCYGSCWWWDSGRLATEECRARGPLEDTGLEGEKGGKCIGTRLKCTWRNRT